MNPDLKGNKIWKHSRPTKYFFPQWCTKFHYKAPCLLGNRIHSQDVEEDSKEALLGGDLTNVQKYCHFRGEVPSGFLVVYVGTEFRRFVIPASYLSLPDFRVLMERVAEEFGYEQEGGLRIPCEEDEFEMIILRCSAKRQKKKV